MSDRYQRQMILPNFGLTAQNKLQAARVLIVGMGGLGCPALQYLVGAGVGHIGIMDADTISLSNLHRQLLFTEKEIGLQKVTVAANKMQLLNAEISIEQYPFHLEPSNARSIISNYDLVIDATDNFPAKYLINDACVLLNKPFVYGAVSRYEGQVAVFNVQQNEGRAINYRDLFPVSPKPGEVPSCAEAGVIGVLPGIIGAMQAAEAIKLITGIGHPLVGRIYHYHLLQAQGYALEITANEQYIPFNEEQIFMREEDDMEDIDVPEISVKEFNRLRAMPEVFVLDVREKSEYPPIDFSDAQIPMSELQNKMHEIPEKEICIVCHQGIRSIYAAQQISQQRNLKVYSLKGGLTAYFK